MGFTEWTKQQKKKDQAVGGQTGARETAPQPTQTGRMTFTDWSRNVNGTAPIKPAMQTVTERREADADLAAAIVDQWQKGVLSMRDRPGMPNLPAGGVKTATTANTSTNTTAKTGSGTRTPAKGKSAYQRAQESTAAGGHKAELEKVQEAPRERKDSGEFNPLKLVGGVALKGADEFATGMTSTAAWLERAALDTIAPGTADRGLFNSINDYFQGVKAKNQELFAPNVAAGGKAAELIDKYGTSTVAAVPQAVLAMVTAGASGGIEAASAAAQAAPGVLSSLRTAAGSMVKDPQYWLSFAQVAGTGYEQAKQDGASETAANLYALYNGLLNAAVEIGGGIQTLPKELRGGKAMVKAWIESMVDEGKEEVAQGIIERGLQNLVYAKENPLASVTDQNAVLNPRTAAEEFLGGAVVGGVLGGGQMAADAVLNGALRPLSLPPLEETQEQATTQTTPQEAPQTVPQAEGVVTQPTGQLPPLTPQTAQQAAQQTEGVVTQPTRQLPPLAQQTAQQGQNNTATQERAAANENMSLVQRVKQSIPTIQDMEPVAEVTGQELPAGNRIVDRLVGFVNAIGNKVNRPGFGDVLFSRGRIKSSVLGHGVGNAKIETFAAVPAVIRSGQQIDYQQNWKGRGYDTYTFAAPVTYRGEKTYMGVIVTRDAQDGRYYVHEVVDADGNIIFNNTEDAEAAPDGRASLSGAFDTVAAPATDTTIPQQAPTVNAEPAAGDAEMTRPGGRVSQGGMNDGAAGQQAGGSVSDGGQGRVAGTGTGGQAGGVAARPGRTRAATEQIRRAADRQNLAQALRPVSTRSLGLRNGSEAQSVKVIPEGQWDAELRDVAERVQRETGKRATFVLGNLWIETEDGVKGVRGVWTQDGLIVQADNMRATPGQIADHEIFHDKAFQTPGLVREIEDRIVQQYGEEELRGVLQAYLRNQKGIIDVPEGATELELEQAELDILEEVFADAYAGINAFRADAPRYAREVNETLADREGGTARETAAATDRTTGPPAGRYSYAGRNANRANSETMAEAEQMERDGVDPETIRQETGWFRGMDGLWRWEIDDSGMEYHRGGDALFRRDHPEYARHQELVDKMFSGTLTEEETRELRDLDRTWGGEYARLSSRVNEGSATLENLITHDELFRNYPQLRNTRVRFMEMEDGTMGRYIRQTNTIQLNRSLRDAPESTLLHEVQHAIQSAEGFASGSNPEYWNREGTRRLDAADEAESRLREEYRQRVDSDPVLADLIRRYNAGELTDAEFNRAYDEHIEGDPEYADLERRIREAERDSLLYSTASDYDLYYNTAGEIEARDAASRRDLTQEQRRQMAPDLGGEDTVFAEGGADGYSMTDDGSEAKWTPERIENLLRNYGATSSPNYSRAYATTISPEDFLSLTTQDVGQIESESQPLDAERLRGEQQEIFLVYDPETPGEVSGHEGRHRMVALRNAGVQRVPVVIQFMGSEGRYNRQPITNLELTGQEFRSGRAPGRVTLTDLVPISRAYKDELGRKFGAGAEAPAVKVKFSMEDPVEETEDLLALHNMTAKNLTDALELGGLPMPSIAVVKAEAGHSKYGPISLVFDKTTIDPEADSRNKVYGGDAYTPTAPTVEYPVNSDRLTQIEDELNRLAGTESVAGGIFGSSSILRSMDIDDASGQSVEELAKKLSQKDTVRAAYLADHGEALEPVKTEKVWDRYGNDTLQKVIDRIGPQELAGIADSLQDGASAEQALGGHVETIRDILREYYRESGEPMLRRAAARNQWPEDVIREKREARVNNTMEKNVSVFTLENLARHAWEMYEDDSATKGEIDRFATSDALRAAVSDSAVEEWIAGKLDGLLGAPGIYNGAERFTPSGRQRSFRALHYPYTLENIVKAMKTNQPERGGQTWGISPGSLQATAASSYSSIPEIKRDSGRLGKVEGEDYDARMEDVDNKIRDAVQRVRKENRPHADNTFEEEEIIGSILMDAASGKKTAAAIMRAFSKEDYKISLQTAKAIQQLYQDAAALPTEYFEAKPQRAVGFDEVLAAVIPDDSGTELREGLQRAGVRTLEYRAGDDADRLRAVNSVDNAKFSVEDGQYTDLEEREDVVLGDEDEAYTEGAAPVQFVYAVVPAEALIVSNDQHGSVNPAYPPELQPRDRSRTASQLQIQGMSRALNPRLLADSPTAQNGAPIVRGDGAVIGGNARTSAILAAYEAGTADAYETFIRERGARYGIDTSNLPERPVLIRMVRGEPGTNWAGLAQELNAATTASYSATEQAMTDASKMEGILDLLVPNDEGTINNRENQTFIQRFVQQVVPASERGGMLTGDGMLSQAGLERAQYAVFAYAYNNPELLAKLSESLDDDTRNVTKALLDTAAAAVSVRAGIEAGNLYDVPAVDSVLNAAGIYTEAKRRGETVEEFVAQRSLTDSYSAEEVFLAQFIENNKRSGKQIRAMLNGLYEEVMSYGDPDQESLFGGGEDHDTRQALEGAIRRYERETGRQLGRPDFGGDREDPGVAGGGPETGGPVTLPTVDDAAEGRGEDAGTDGGGEPAPGAEPGELTLPTPEEPETTPEPETPVPEEPAPPPAPGRDLRAELQRDLSAEAQEPTGDLYRPEGMSDAEYNFLNARWKANRANETPGLSAADFESTDAYDRALEERAEAAKAERMRNISREEFTGTPALEKLGVKVANSVGIYDFIDSLIANDKAAKSVRKEMKRAERRLQATEAERNFASGVAAGIYSEADIPSSMDADKVMELADYYWAERAVSADMIRQQRTDIAKALSAKMDELFKDSDAFKPSRAIVLNNRTPERNMLHIFGDERGAAINAAIFDPVAANEAERYRFINRMHDEVRTFEDSQGRQRRLNKEERALVQRVIEGRAVGEIVAGMEMKEAIQNAAQNIRNGEDAGDAARTFGLDIEQTRLAEKYARWMETQEALESGRVDTVKVENAAKKYSEMFDQFYAAINDFLVAHGYEPIGFIKGYAPHIQPESNQNLLNKSLQAMGINTDVTRLPSSIAGLTANYKPNKRWNPYFLSRTSDVTQYDIASAFESYVDYMSDILYHTDDIMRVRQAANYFRRTYAPEEIRENLNWAEELRYRSVEEKANFLRDNEVLSKTSAMTAGDINQAMEDYVSKLYDDISKTTKYSELVSYLDNYANILAGKQSMADRGWEYSSGRTVLNLGNKLVRAFGRAQVAGNLSSALNQTAQLPQITAELGARWTGAAALDVWSGKLRRAGWAQQSDFLTGKHGVDYLVTDPADMVITTLFKPAEIMDGFMSTIAVRGKYLQEIQRGKTPAEAMKAADTFGKNIMGSRMKGSRPLAFEAKNPVSQMLHVFQVEAVNQWEHLTQDLPRDFRTIEQERGKAAAARSLAGVIVKMLIAAFALNRLDEWLYGGTPAPFDLMGLSANFIASGEGLTTNALLRTVIDNGWEKLTGERLFDTDADALGGDFDWGTAAEDTAYNIANDIPYLRNAAGLLGLGDETLPIPNLYGAGRDIASAVRDDGALSLETLRAVGGLATELLPGGRQISKTGQGLETVLRGGRYKGDGDEARLQYPVDMDFANVVRALMFGNSALEETEAFYAGDDTALTAKQTRLHDSLVDAGADSQEVYGAIQDWRKIDNDETLTSVERGQMERALVDSLSLPDGQKLDMYQELSGAKSRTEDFRALLKGGMSLGDIFAAYDKYAELNAGELKASQKATEYARWADENLTRREAAAVKDKFVFYSMSPAEATKYESLTTAGLDTGDAYDLAQTLAGLEPEDGRETVSNLQRFRAVADSGLPQEEQRDVVRSMLEDSALEKFEAVAAAGITVGQWVDYKEATENVTADKGLDGKTISGSKKAKVLRIINGMDLTAAQKTALYREAGYSDNTLDDAPWYGGGLSLPSLG